MWSIVCFTKASARERLFEFVFKNHLRKIQQIEYLGKPLNRLQLLKDAYKLAEPEPHGHLIIDFYLKTSQALCFASQLIGTDSSIF